MTEFRRIEQRLAIVVAILIVISIKLFYPELHWLAAALLFIVLTALSFVGPLAAKREESQDLQAERPTNVEKPAKTWILDTSALIDGRILSLAKVDLVAERLLIPEFVLAELHFLSDRSSKSRRARGRRGLEIASDLADLTNIESCQGKIANFRDYAQSKSLSDKKKSDKKSGKDQDDEEAAVDEQLISLAKEREAVLVSVDRGLLDRAKIAGVTVLALHELALELQSPAVPGDLVEITVIKAGEGKDQGVGYLADGTMVVIEKGKAHLNHEIRVEISSSIKTRNGPLIFAKFRERLEAAAVSGT